MEITKIKEMKELVEIKQEEYYKKLTPTMKKYEQFINSLPENEHRIAHFYTCYDILNGLEKKEKKIILFLLKKAL